MPKKPSDRTLLQNCRSELRRAVAERDLHKRAAETYRVRATKSEQECAEWKARFDKLLERMPDDPL